MKRHEVRQVDEVAIREFGMTGLVLMENAGRGAAQALQQWCDPKVPVQLLCGSGNNGGDGYVIARHLQLAGYKVQILSLASFDRLADDARVNATIAELAEIPILHVTEPTDFETAIQNGETVIDCLLGTGAQGAPRGLYRVAVEAANEREGRRVAIDLPSGLDCDSGVPSDTTFRADVTITFVAPKDGFANPTASPFLGDIAVVPIGVPLKLLARFGLATEGNC
ncbi:MAG: NAD(P)H-hydrate epimerase [Planctomycetota bacterium]